jgi:lipoyl(octanoyl) transferase
MLQFVDWGLVEYSEALKRQEELLEEVHSKKNQGFIVYCTHPPVVTLGRKTEKSDVFAWQGPVVEVSRGGRATYHGPSQLVIYLIISLDHPDNTFPKKDIAWFLRNLETAIVHTLKKYKVEALGRSLQKKTIDIEAADETGVWVNDKKIASLGIAVRKWITFHGAAINLDDDPSAFKGLNPCGFKSEVMISLEKLVNHKINREEFKSILKKELLDRIN